MLIANLLVFQQIGQNFQEMRFTTSKEAGDPHAHFGGRSKDTFLICRIKIRKVPLKFARYNIFFQFLCYVCFCALSNNNNALKFAINLFAEHIFDLHNAYFLLVTVQAETPGNNYHPLFR